MNALIIVDVQKDFLPGGRLAVADGDTIIPYINELQSRYDIVVATQDWHPGDHGSFASQHPGHSPFETIVLNGLPQVLWPDHCVQETDGASFADKLRTDKIGAIFRKGMDKRIDSYSGFYDNGRLKKTGLSGFLKDMGVDEVHVCGLAADYCVFFTAMDSLSEGFQTGILLDATKAIDPRQFESKKQAFLQRGGQLY
ncbi:nicotinamidase/pyrazinamidase [Sphingobacterium allocomposti]|uniref:Nicotinamidase n=1 Tax=Sphingobacterium allocomposti TaxID=415956 RepID=A0A5S5D6U9_9SPHI|nr:bifunctional nicotinamidase/pyrazinamidase [Sphingobacterium composti Yoo et al. 2007 non Ten et al. 2007]TYP91184.1 nicotinamidase/pyrazinamidase [Sphingobacterium composti Yoo et al. 2007 non Ten et al. 2007]HLS94548.1 bifunctional nicotinamidase/pyrazinamidase [Sphingobacterium sp.]